MSGRTRAVASGHVDAPREMVLDIERVVAGGDGLARNESLVVLVPRTLAGERVRAHVAIKGRMARGRLRDVEFASTARITPDCAHYDTDRCGGCQLQHASYPEQLRIKGEIVAESLRRIARRDVPVPFVHPSIAPWRYRRKLTLALRRKGSEWYAGLRRHDDPDAVFHLHDCLITTRAVVRVWSDVMRASAHLPNARELRGAVRVSDDGAASFALEGARAWPESTAFFDRVASIRSLWWTPEQGKRRRLALRSDGEAKPDASFVQVNAATAMALRDHVLSRVRSHKPTHVIDGYAGAGDGAVLLASKDVRVTAIEVDEDAASWARERLEPPSRVVTATVEGALASALPADVIVLNPPRGGVHPRVCEIVETASRTRSIVYVSCDPATLARDLSRMPSWRIASIMCFDMFPQTAHVETVCELIPASSAA